MYNRVVIKLSGEALSGDGNGSSKESGSNIKYDKELINSVLTDILNVTREGTQVSLVFGGGNIWRGKNSDPDMDRVKADQMGMLSTVINSIYISDKIRLLGGKAVVLTPFHIGNMTELYSKEKALEYMDKGYIVIFAGGLGHPYFSTDTIPVLRALELEADCILFAKSVDGVYSKDPNKHEDAIKYQEISYKKIVEENLQAMDLAGMILCQENKINSLVFSLSHPNSIYIACKDNNEIYDFGTRIIY